MSLLDTSDLHTLSARERILLTAHRLFYTHGIHATGIDRIIHEARVTKVTFYRHFPSKHALILAFLDFRHERWMNWFREALLRHDASGRGLQAIVSVLREWFAEETYRGCAFLNTLVELGGSTPEVTALIRQHKQAMTQTLIELIPGLKTSPEKAQAVTLAIDGAILHAQLAPKEQEAQEALASLSSLLEGYGIDPKLPS